MKHFLVLLLLLACAAPLSAVAQQSATAAYGTAETVPAINGHFLIIHDGVTPNPRGKIFEVNGKDRRFADEAAILNFLYEQGWEVIPHGILKNGNNKYMLRRRTQ